METVSEGNEPLVVVDYAYSRRIVESAYDIEVIPTEI